MAVMRAGRGHFHIGASSPDMVTPWMAQRAALGDPPKGVVGQGFCDSQDRTSKRGGPDRVRGSWGGPPAPLPHLLYSPLLSLQQPRLQRTPLGQRLRHERRKALTAGREAWSEGARGWVGVGRGGRGDIQTPMLLRSPHSGSVWDQAWPVAPSLPALRPQSRSRVPPGPPGTGVSEGGGGGEKGPHTLPFCLTARPRGWDSCLDACWPHSASLQHLAG